MDSRKEMKGVFNQPVAISCITSAGRKKFKEVIADNLQTLRRSDEESDSASGQSRRWFLRIFGSAGIAGLTVQHVKADAIPRPVGPCVVFDLACGEEDICSLGDSDICETDSCAGDSCGNNICKVANTCDVNSCAISNVCSRTNVCGSNTPFCGQKNVALVHGME